MQRHNFLPLLFSLSTGLCSAIPNLRGLWQCVGLSNSAPVRKTFDFICSMSWRWGRRAHLWLQEERRHRYLVLGDTKLTMHLSLNNVNALRIQWQWSWCVHWRHRAVRLWALWPCCSIMWPPAPLEHPTALLSSARLCLRPTFLLRHTALAPHLIYTVVEQSVNAEKPAKKNLICSLLSKAG